MFDRKWVRREQVKKCQEEKIVWYKSFNAGLMDKMQSSCVPHGKKKKCLNLLSSVAM